MMLNALFLHFFFVAIILEEVNPPNVFFCLEKAGCFRCFLGSSNVVFLFLIVISGFLIAVNSLLHRVLHFYSDMHGYFTEFNSPSFFNQCISFFQPFCDSFTCINIHLDFILGVPVN